MDPASATTSFPLGLVVLLVATTGVGVLMLVAGQRLLLTTLGVLGGVVGAAVGWALFAVLLSDAPAWVGAVALGTVGAILMALSARLVVALALAAVLGAAGWLSVASADRHGWIGLEAGPIAAASASDATASRAAAPRPTVARVVTDAAEERALGAVRDEVGTRLLRMTDPVRTPELEHRLGALATFVGASVREIGHHWDRTQPAVRTLMLASAGMCAFLGLCLGLVAPRFTASGLTAALGATLLTVCVLVAIQQFTSTPDTLPGSPLVWLGLWSMLTLGGAIGQSMRRQNNRGSTNGSPVAA